MIEVGELIATEEVLHDTEKKEDELYKWLAERTGMFREVDAKVQRAVKEILAKFPRLLDTRRGRSASDPFVIGLAYVEKCVVVTQEAETHNMQKPNIPDVCNALGVKSINLLDLIRSKGWKFASV